MRATGWHTVCVQDAYKLMPWGDVVYGCNASWWRVHKNCPGFQGELWSSHGLDKDGNNPKTEAAESWGVKLVGGLHRDGFSMNPELIHYGSNSGFQAVNLALLFGCTSIVLVGFDMRYVAGKAHFFGNHADGLHQCSDEQYRKYAKEYYRATVPEGVTIINATPDSALRCFPMMPLEEAIESTDYQRVPVHGRDAGSDAVQRRDSGVVGAAGAAGFQDGMCEASV